MKALIKKIYTQDETGNGMYQYDMYGKEDIINAVIPNAYVGMEIEIEEKDGITRVTPTEKSQGIAHFLCSYVKGIGPAKASNVTWDFFYYVSNEDVEAVCETLKIKEDKAKEVISICNDNKDMLELYMLTNGVCTELELSKIYETYKEGSASVVRNKPYSLTDIHGFGFLRVDKIACATGVTRDSTDRVAAAIEYCLTEAAYQNGNCFLYKGQLMERLYSLLADVPKSVGKAKERAVLNAVTDWDNKKEKFIKAYKPEMEEILLLDGCAMQREKLADIIPDACEKGVKDCRFVIEDDRFYLFKMYISEMSSAKRLRQMLDAGCLVKFTPDILKRAVKDVEDRKTALLRSQGLGDFVTTDEQKNAVGLAALSRVCVISGGPGRGKTAIAEMIAKAYELATGDEKCCIMVAPTGKAAQRITESTGFPASTIHRIVGTRKPIGKLIIVDESSMIDIELFARLVAWGEESTFVFLGDVDQIASIGPGRVLKDLMESNVIPYIKLIQGHRNSGSIAKNSEKINEGKPVYTYIIDNAFKFIPSTKEAITNTFLHFYFLKVATYGIKNVLAITPSRKGMVGIDALNRAIQEKYTKGQPEIALPQGGVFRVGDRVMHIKNNLMFKLKAKQEDGSYKDIMGVFNGDMGTVAKICDEGAVVVFDDGKIGAYAKENLSQLTLAYVITIHKCQGSEATCVIMGATFADCFLMNRNLFYTGETRAKKEMVLIGEQKPSKNGRFMTNAFNYAAYKVNDDMRQTTLADKIAG